MKGLEPIAHDWLDSPGGGKYCFQCGTDWWVLREKTSAECSGVLVCVLAVIAVFIAGKP